MNDPQKLLLALCCIIASIIIGQAAGLMAIFSALILFPAAVILILRTVIKPVYKVLFITFGVIANDLLLRLYPARYLDSQGAGWITTFFLLILLLVSVIILIELKFTQKQRLASVLWLTLLPLIAGGLYLFYFGTLGLSYNEPESNSKELSLKKGIFISDLIFSDTEINYQNDSIKFIDGWAEKQMRLNHTNLIRKHEDWGEVCYIINIKHNLDRPYNHNTYFKVNSKDINGAAPLDSVVRFNLPKSTGSISLAIFKLTDSIRHDTIIKEIKITQKL